MLDYKILKNKGKLYKKNSNGTTEEFLDLLTKSCNSMDSTAGDIIIVNKYYIARPDLISLAVYGSDEYADIAVLKIERENIACGNTVYEFWEE